MSHWIEAQIKKYQETPEFRRGLRRLLVHEHITTLEVWMHAHMILRTYGAPDPHFPFEKSLLCYQGYVGELGWRRLYDRGYMEEWDTLLGELGLKQNAKDLIYKRNAL